MLCAFVRRLWRPDDFTSPFFASHEQPVVPGWRDGLNAMQTDSFARACVGFLGSFVAAVLSEPCSELRCKQFNLVRKVLNFETTV